MEYVYSSFEVNWNDEDADNIYDYDGEGIDWSDN